MVALLRPVRREQRPTAPPTRCRRSRHRNRSIPISRPIAGMTDCSAVLPDEATSIAAIEQQEMSGASAPSRRRRDCARSKPRRCIRSVTAMRNLFVAIIARFAERRSDAVACNVRKLAKRRRICQRSGLRWPRTEHSCRPSSARTLKGPRRLQRRRDRRSPSPHWQFLRGFIKNPVMVGSIIPSSRVLIDKMLDPVDWANTRLFVEYGPGVGTFTTPGARAARARRDAGDDRHQPRLHPLSRRN